MVLGRVYTSSSQKQQDDATVGLTLSERRTKGVERGSLEPEFQNEQTQVQKPEDDATV